MESLHSKKKSNSDVTNINMEEAKNQDAPDS
jgi:hypothetical protein